MMIVDTYELIVNYFSNINNNTNYKCTKILNKF